MHFFFSSMFANIPAQGWVDQLGIFTVLHILVSSGLFRITIFYLCILLKKILLLHSNVFSASLLAGIPASSLTDILVKYVF